MMHIGDGRSLSRVRIPTALKKPKSKPVVVALAQAAYGAAKLGQYAPALQPPPDWRKVEAFRRWANGFYQR
jgi:hypothetical protein